VINNNGEMPFFDHIKELRYRLLISLSSLVLVSIIGYNFTDLLLSFLISSSIHYVEGMNLQVLKITDMFMVKIWLSIFIGIILSLPVFLYNAWSFISPAIDKKANFLVFLLMLSSIIFFVVGAIFSYKIIIPTSILFFKTVSGPEIFVDYNIELKSFLLYLIWMLFTGGIVFQLPVVSVILNRLGIISKSGMAKKRRYVFIAILIFSAIITPPDPLSQILFTIPIVILYEISILIVKIIGKQNKNEI